MRSDNFSQYLCGRSPNEWAVLVVAPEEFTASVFVVTAVSGGEPSVFHSQVVSAILKELENKGLPIVLDQAPTPGDVLFDIRHCLQSETYRQAKRCQCNREKVHTGHLQEQSVYRDTEDGAGKLARH